MGGSNTVTDYALHSSQKSMFISCGRTKRPEKFKKFQIGIRSQNACEEFGNETN